MIKEDLEILTGEVINDDITMVLYHLLKDSPQKESLTKFLKYCVDNELREEVMKNVNKPVIKTDKQKVCYGRLSLEDWISRQV